MTDEQKRHKIALETVTKRLEYARSILPSEPQAVTKPQLSEMNKLLLDCIYALSGEYRTLN